jgi:hypothetical protein
MSAKRAAFSHLVHPVRVDKDSDLVIAQPITFESMRVAREFAEGAVDVNLLAIQYLDEAPLPLPECFARLPGLDRSVGDCKAFRFPRKLALIADLLEALYRASRDGYLVYSNVDIALQPYFYLTLARIADQGYDAFVINRRTIQEHYERPEQLPLMYPELGDRHPGWDCFVFRRDLFPAFQLGDACIGSGWIGRVLLSNMACLAGKFKIFTDLHLTFHVGNRRPWRSDRFDDYIEHNQNECRKILLEFERKLGPLDRSWIPGRFLNLLERKAGQ